MTRKIITLLWKEATIFLDRKNVLARQCMEDRFYTETKLGRDHLFFNRKEQNKMIKLYKSGMTLDDAAAPLGASRSCLRKTMERRGMKLRTKKKTTEGD